MTYTETELKKQYQEIFEAYAERVGREWAVENFREAYRGTYDSPEQFAREVVYELYGFDSLPDPVKHNIDWQGIADQLENNHHYIETAPNAVHVFLIL